ncbi:MAG: UDP-2,3-diacylglucosamine diphosphatase [Saprospiraceae bacterium]|nr:UDP-2,3-diacylglucosamine diphosphatase [Saprospiraceae bacterium]
MSKVYFASDFHLGVPAKLPSREREKLIVRWLDKISKDATELYLVGDVFDFWFEYSSVVPKGYIRLLGKLAELTDGGLPIYFFIGNHDMWMFKYFEEELGIPTFREPIIREIQGKKMMIGHGDGLGPGDNGYKFIKKVFANPACQWLFARLHPNLGIGIANFWSAKSRYANVEPDRFVSEENEWLVQFAKDTLKENHFDYFVFGHRHLPISFNLQGGSQYINLGDWLNHQSFGIMENGDLQLAFYENEHGKIYRN